MTLNSCEDGPKDMPVTRLDGAAVVAERDSSGTDQAEIRGECKAECADDCAEQASQATPLNDMCGTDSACVSKGVASQRVEEEWSSNVKKTAVSITIIVGTQV